jgi:MoxR-like ATPase
LWADLKEIYAMSELEQAASALREAIARSNQGLVERAALTEAVVLAAVAGEHVLVIGPPGTAKSEAVRRMSRAVGGSYFEYLLGRFTEPSEIFGPVDLQKLRDGVVETATAGMLPEADMAFLDEVFQGSTAILNTLLGVLNERVFRRGHTHMHCTLRLCVAASNALPDDEALAAFADRFLLRVFVDPVPDPRIEELLENGWSLNRNVHHNFNGAASALDSSATNSSITDLSTTGSSATASLRDIETLAAAVLRTDMAEVRPLIATAMRMLRSAGIFVTDRRVVKAQKLVAAACVLDGRTTPGPDDLWPLVFAVPTREEQAAARDIWRDLLAISHNAALPAAAEDASQGPLARATRIAKSASDLLNDAPPQNSDAHATWHLKLEGVAREIDAGFALQDLPPHLAEIRARLVETLGLLPGNAVTSSDAQTTSDAEETAISPATTPK